MRTNPILDGLGFFTGDIASRDAIGDWRFLFSGWAVALAAAGIGIAVAAWRADPAQRSAQNAAIWLVRFMIGGMWLEGSSWKLPLPQGGGLPYWLDLMGKNAAFDTYGWVIREVLIPHVQIFSCLIFLTESTLAVCLMLGFAVRLAGLIGIAMSLNLWIGLYRYGPEWPWIYVFIALLHLLFIVTRAGRSLGLDAVAGPAIGRFSGRLGLGWLYRLAA